MTKRSYEEPRIVTEEVFETLAAGCDLVSIEIGGCDPSLQVLLNSV